MLEVTRENSDSREIFPKQCISTPCTYLPDTRHDVPVYSGDDPSSWKERLVDLRGSIKGLRFPPDRRLFSPLAFIVAPYTQYYEVIKMGHKILDHKGKGLPSGSRA